MKLLKLQPLALFKLVKKNPKNKPFSCFFCVSVEEDIQKAKANEVTADKEGFKRQKQSFIFPNCAKKKYAGFVKQKVAGWLFNAYEERFIRCNRKLGGELLFAKFSEKKL